MEKLNAPWIKLKESLDREDFNQINELQELCIRCDQIALKLELDYKLAAALESTGKTDMKINEFMYFEGQQLIGYIGIGDFGGIGSQLEITGMVHPEYRRQGIFTMLHELVMAECKRRKAGSILLLCDNKSGSGQSFIKKLGARYKNSEFEMYLQQDRMEINEERLCGIIFRKAVNADAYEIARQNTIYFGDHEQFAEPNLGENNSDTVAEKGITQDNLPIPEDEEKLGMTTYLAEIGNQVVGKVNLQMNTAVGGIYGLGVLPEYRGRGLGRAILLRAVEKLMEADKKSIMLQVAAKNAKALHLYQSCGFLETSTMDYYDLKP